VQKYDSKVFEGILPTISIPHRDYFLKTFYYDPVYVLTDRVSDLQLEEPPAVPISPPEEEPQPVAKSAKIYDDLMKKLLIVD